MTEPAERSIRWIWPVVLVALLAIGPWAAWHLEGTVPLPIAVVDKTVPFETRIEHRSLYWLLDHLRIVKPDGTPYDRDRDYFGAFPGPRPGDPPARTTSLTAEAAKGAKLVYLADTYGVYRDDLKSGEAMEAALERSPKIYGGLETGEAEAAAAAVAAGRILVSEFNTLGSPTEAEPRRILETALGVRWTRWIGRYFVRLDDPAEVPGWLRRDYEREWSKPWSFTGPGYVLVQDDAHVEVLRPGRECDAVGLVIDRQSPADRILAGAADGVPYPYWFDVVEAAPATETLARFAWRLSPDGAARLRDRGLPETFPAVTRRRAPSGGGTAYYFAGDFADNPMDDVRVPLAGYATLRRWLEAAKLAPSETAFYWRFYVPMMERIVEEAKGR